MLHTTCKDHTVYRKVSTYIARQLLMLTVHSLQHLLVSKKLLSIQYVDNRKNSIVF